MSTAKPFDYKTFSVSQRLKEIGMFFQKRDPVHQALRRLARRLEKCGIPYAVMGGMAVNLHGARRTTDDVDILLNQQGLDRFRQEFLGTSFDQPGKNPRRFVDRQNGGTLDVLVTGRYPGTGEPGPIAS